MKKYKLGEIIDVNRGTSLSGKYYSSEGEYVRLTLGNFDFNLNSFKENESKNDIYFTGKFDKKFLLNKNDIITPLTEQVKGLIGSTAKIPESGKYIQSQDVALIKSISSDLYDNYLFYLFSSSIVRKQLSDAAQQTKIRHTSPDKIKDATVFLPDFDYQKKSSLLLDNISEKISINTNISFVLEELIKTIFDYWFVQFEFPDENGLPYKSSGGDMEFNQQLNKEIPKGWNTGNLYDIADFINGLACQKYRPKDETKKLPVIKITEMHKGFTDNTEFVKNDVPEKYVISNGDILFSWSATLETIIWCGGTGCLNQHIFKVIPKRYCKCYTYMQLSSYIINFVKMAQSRKTTMGHITTDHLKQSVIVLPPKELVEKFDKKINKMFEGIVESEQNKQKYFNLKNYLLPLIINQQLRFKKKAS